MTENATISTNELEARQQKLENIRVRDGVVWKDKFERTNTISGARELADGALVKTAGRVTALRWLGKLMFGRIYDIDGEIQFSMSREELGEDQYKFMKANVDMGDFVGLTGELYHTTAGELTIKVSSYEILAKALRPLPEKFHGLTDTETRYRQRYLDIIANPDTRRTMKIRFSMLRFIRNFLEANGFIEVETPILKAVSSGAAAKPFTTHHNALDTDLFLRIAPELPLKECIAAGFDRVFELGKNFRNEGMDAMHLQEFTMMEWYAAYWDYNDNIDFSWKMIQEMLMAIRGTLQIEYQGTKLDFSSYAKLDYTAKMNELIDANILDFDDVEKLKKHIVKKGLFPAGELEGLKSLFAVVDYVFKRKIRDEIIQPTVTYNYPTFTRPLARRNDKDARLVDNFQLIAMGAELINAYSELVDPIEQRKSFEEQMANKAAGDDESVDFDEDFMLAMEHGMPPISGLGFGFDRWVSLLTDQPTLRDVILFPIMK
ncbi:MAG: lysine--tRNA ligase [Alphaproteobacteria bacterium]|nr:lysine--tRNA ligase [Alphaproteobacteria bacterium]MBN2674878.1 lysine--tRNA ligase [Alphaproteobacteria bacterium]